MQSEAEQIAGVTAFYDAHPINEEQILHALKSKGIALDTVSEEVLKDHDQDHFGGIPANDILAAQADIRPEHHVLDVCSGMGGPARYLALRIGCKVTGLDFTKSRFHGAQRLTKLAGLDHLVDFRHGNALEMPFEDATFDVVIGQEAWCHVPDKPRLISECARVLKANGVIAFTDILRRPTLTQLELERLQSEMTFPTLETIDGYAALLRERAHAQVRWTDLSAEWARILIQRLAMYRGLKQDTVAKFGAEHFRKWDSTYAFFVGLFGDGKLGGGRFIARRSAEVYVPAPADNAGH